MPGYWACHTKAAWIVLYAPSFVPLRSLLPGEESS